jgi:GntR family transcriptional regulator
MKLTRPVPMWQQVADQVRDQILDGTYPAGQALPSEEALSAEFGVSRPTIREGIKALISEGLVEVSRPRGTMVRDPFGRPTRTEQHNGSVMGADSGWKDTGDPVFIRLNATIDRAELLGIPAGEPLLVREALQESGGLRRLSRLYVPFSVAEHTPWGDDPHLPASTALYEYFRAEHPILTWTEHVRARMPVGDESAQLEVPTGVPLLMVLRLCHAHPEQDTRTLALEEALNRADQIEVAYTLL